MDILVQTREHIYHVSWKGIKKVETVNWDKLKATFDGLFAFQANEAKKANERPVFKKLDQHVADGVVAASANDRAWRDKRVRTMDAPREEEGDFDLLGGWVGNNDTGIDRVSRSLKNMKLQSQ